MPAGRSDPRACVGRLIATRITLRARDAEQIMVKGGGTGRVTALLVHVKKSFG